MFNSLCTDEVVADIEFPIAESESDWAIEFNTRLVVIPLISATLLLFKLEETPRAITGVNNNDLFG